MLGCKTSTRTAEADVRQQSIEFSSEEERRKEERRKEERRKDCRDKRIRKTLKVTADHIRASPVVKILNRITRHRSHHTLLTVVQVRVIAAVMKVVNGAKVPAVFMMPTQTITVLVVKEKYPIVTAATITAAATVVALC